MKVVLALLLLIIAGVFGFYALNSSKKFSGGTFFYYYPKENIYYNVAAKKYIFISTDGKEWKEENDLPATHQALSDKYVTLDHPPLPVWSNNEQHRIVYGAALYASPADIQKQFYEDSVNSLPKKVDVPEVPEEKEKKKSRIGRILEKIFH